MGATWLYEHKQNHKKSSLKLLVRFWNNLIEMFLEWPFSELFLKFWSVNKHGISEWRLLALYRHKEILVNSSLKATKKNGLEQSQKIRWAIQGHLGPLVLLTSLNIFTSTGQCAIVIALCLSCVRPFVRACICKLFLQKTSQKLLTGFLPNFTGMFLRWSSFKFLQIIVFHEEFWLSWQPQ